MNRTEEKRKMHALRIADIREYIAGAIDRPLQKGELDSLERLNEQDLHLLAATLDEYTKGGVA